MTLVSGHGAGHVPKTTFPTRGLVGMYIPDDNDTTSHQLMDRSGNGKALVAGQGSWTYTNGPLGRAVVLESGAYNSMRFDPTLITYNAAWSVAILSRSTSWASVGMPAVDENILINVYQDVSHRMAIHMQKDTGQNPVRVNGSGVLNAPNRMYSTDDWIWTIMAYDPGTLYNRNPSQLVTTLGASASVANPFTGAITIIEIGSTQGTQEIGAVLFYNRVITRSESFYIANQTAPVVPPAGLKTHQKVRQFLLNDTSPSVKGGGLFRANANDMTILDDMRDGDEVAILMDASSFLRHSSNMRLSGGTDITGVAHMVVRLGKFGSTIYQLGPTVTDAS